MTPLPLDDIQARAEAATPPPWTSEYRSGQGWFLVGPNASTVGWLTEADVAFLVAARSDIPALVEECRRLRADLEEIRDAMTYPTFDDERIGYVEVQLDRDVWEKIKAEKDAVRAALEPRP